jgi:hypothetical protein
VLARRLAYTYLRDDVNTVKYDISSSTRSSSLFVGNAHVYGYTSLDEPNDDGSRCAQDDSRHYYYINVEVKVAWGGSCWACPSSMPDHYCEATICKLELGATSRTKLCIRLLN